jgi:hypothetical protein
VLDTYQALARLALEEFEDVIADTKLVGGTPASPNKLRLVLTDRSYLDIWLSAEGDYAYHWEQRRQSGLIFRWDNAPHHPQVSTYPAHLHSGDEDMVVESHLKAAPQATLRHVLGFIRQRLTEQQ